MPRLALCLVLVLVLAAAPAVQAQRIKLPYGVPELEQRAQKDSNDAAAYYNLALGYWNAKRFDDAERGLQTAVRLQPRFAEAHLALGYLPYARMPKLWETEYKKLPDSLRRVVERARSAERHALLIDPLVDLRIMAAAMPGKSGFWYSSDDAEGYYDTFIGGYEDIAKGDYVSGYRRFNELIDAYRKNFSRDLEKAPWNWVWHRGLAASHLPDQTEGALRDFESLYNRMLVREKSDTIWSVPLVTNDLRYMMAAVHHRAGNTAEALRLYQKAAEEDIGLYMAYVQMANIYEQQRDYPHAIEQRQRAVNANPDDPSLLMDLGAAQGKAGRFAEAAVTLRQSLEGNPRNALAHFWLGLDLMQMSKRDEAKASFNRFLELTPSRFTKQIELTQKYLGTLQ